MSADKPKLLCVDDEQLILDGLSELLSEDYDIRIANGGQAALDLLKQNRDVAVVMTDFRMPHMDGATFLHEVIQLVPTATRILLTGEAGVQGAQDAVNKGQIFRFLAKPCRYAELKPAIEEGVARHRLLNAERLVMQETLLECIAVLTEVLAVTNPVAFGRAQRIKRLVGEIATRLDIVHFWQLEAAALLSQIGYFAESPDLAEKIYYARPLSAAEQARAAAVPKHAQRLFEHVPRLEPVLQIVMALDWSDAQIAAVGDRMVGLGASVLGAAIECDLLETQGLANDEIAPRLQQRGARYGAKVLDAFTAHLGAESDAEDEVILPLRNAITGMRLREEIRTSAGALLVPVGFEVSVRLIERISQLTPDMLDRPVRFSPVRARPESRPA